MYDFRPDPSLDPHERYRQLCEAADALTRGESDGVANMANVASLLWLFLPDLNWAGFYRAGTNASGAAELVLGPFMGQPACIRIAVGAGVCGTAFATGKTQLVRDVQEFPGHIACDAATRSELVVPIMHHGRAVALIDLDSPETGRFESVDARGIERLAALLADRV